ncbi:hypothetical protein [Limosilactobacillus reuteri]|uniref:Phage protein n=1 Tax=Limosilactobacillus reuteri TaxID=1598 RepID=A0ABD6Y766_LIMRT|nr:hypothetical protein [Limosilactobacillus reuteri]PWT37676.1 hypothetical protein DKZ35_04140 [Limosilactobacillus reuteri]
MIDINTIKLPTHFSKLDSQEESRFIPVKIYIAHTGENLNNSIFSKEVLENMIPTLTNIPILGYVSTNADGEKDFRGHEKNITIDGTEVTINYKTNAYGFIPESNDAHFEVTGGKEWLVANGYLWSRFIDALNIFDESGGTKGQSMEVSHADGYTDKYGRVVYTSAQFEGLCILGDDVPPAMAGSVISTEFSKADFKSAFKEMLAEFSAEKGENSLATKKKDEEGTTVVTDTTSDKETAAKPNDSSISSTAKADKAEATDDAEKAAQSATTESQETEKSKSSSADNKASERTDDKKSQNLAVSSSTEGTDYNSANDDTAEMSASKDKTIKDDQQVESDDKKNNSEDSAADDQDNDEEDKDKEKFEFELTLSEKQRVLINEVRNKYFNNSDWCWLECAYDNYGIISVGNSDNKPQYFRVEYTVNADDSLQLGNKIEVFPTYLTAEERAEVEANRQKVTELQSQLDELKAYKSNVEMSKKKAILADNKDELTAEQIKNIESKFTLLTPEDVEKEVAYAIFETHKGEKKNIYGMKAVNFSANKNGLGYGTADVLFRKR